MSTINGKSRKQHLYELQVELCKFQDWLQHSGERVIVVFEGRDTAGKGGMINTIQERVSHRVFQSVALPKPSDREASQWYPQRYVQHFPAAGEVTLFDRSWYNRAGVERVMGFTEPDRVALFLAECANFERAVVESGIRLIKYWLEIDQETQLRRLKDRREDRRKHWKLSPMDVESRRRWYLHSIARDDIFAATDTEHAPWYLVDANDKDTARLNCISHFLSRFDYRETPFDLPELPEVDPTYAYDDRATVASRNWVPRVYTED
jgi:polyphosphate kinase 2